MKPVRLFMACTLQISWLRMMASNRLRTWMTIRECTAFSDDCRAVWPPRAKREFGRIAGLQSMLDSILSDPSNEAAVLLFDSKLDLVQDFAHDSALVSKTLSGPRRHYSRSAKRATP